MALTWQDENMLRHALADAGFPVEGNDAVNLIMRQSRIQDAVDALPATPTVQQLADALRTE